MDAGTRRALRRITKLEPGTYLIPFGDATSEEIRDVLSALRSYLQAKNAWPKGVTLVGLSGVKKINKQKEA